MSKKYVGQTVLISAPCTGTPMPFEAVVKKYEEGWGYLCSNETEEHFFYGWVEDIYDKEGVPIND